MRIPRGGSDLALSGRFRLEIRLSPVFSNSFVLLFRCGQDVDMFRAGVGNTSIFQDLRDFIAQNYCFGLFFFRGLQKSAEFHTILAHRDSVNPDFWS